MLELSCSDDLEYHRKKSDRSITPRRPDFNRLYASYCKDKYGAKNGSEMFENLHSRIEEYITNNEGASIKFQKFAEYEEEMVPLILTIITPLMQRVHFLVSS